MSLKNTPSASSVPTTPAVEATAPTLVYKQNSEMSLAIHGSPLESTPDLNDLTSNITERKKRKYDDDEEDTTSISSKIDEMFSNFSREQDKRFHELQCTIKNLTDQNCELKDCLNMMSAKYDEFLIKITALESERNDDKKTIRQLEDKLEAIERKSRSSGLELRNIPIKDGETKKDLCEIVECLGKTLDVNVESLGIRDTYRIKSKDESNPVIVDFTTVLLKDRFIKSVKRFNKSKSQEGKLNATHINPQYRPKPIYVSETLTHKSHRLFYLARIFQKAHGYSFCWTANGIIYLKKNTGSVQIRISSELDINNLRNAK